MPISGEWKITMKTPMGAQAGTITLAQDGDAVTGSQSSFGETVPIYDATLTPEGAKWKINVSKPVKMKVSVTAQVDGDSISGKAKAGPFPASPFTGSRQ